MKIKVSCLFSSDLHAFINKIVFLSLIYIVSFIYFGWFIKFAKEKHYQTLRIQYFWAKTLIQINGLTLYIWTRFFPSICSLTSRIRTFLGIHSAYENYCEFELWKHNKIVRKICLFVFLQVLQTVLAFMLYWST